MTPIKNAQRGQRRTGGASATAGAATEADGKKLYVRLAERLGRDIVAGRHPPGSLLPKAAQMCATFSISRTTLREAYSILMAKGLIEARARIGTRVRPTNAWNALDPEVLTWRFEATPNREWLAEVLALRQIVEPTAAALAASTASPSAFGRIAEACDRIDGHEMAREDLIRAEIDFHLAILEASGNRLLATISTAISDAVERSLRPTMRRSVRLDPRWLFRHRQVVEAIRDHAPELARHCMSLLLRGAEEGRESANAVAPMSIAAGGTRTRPAGVARAGRGAETPTSR